MTPPGRALATRLRGAAVEQMAQLKFDSALTLYRASRAADETYLPAQVEYIRHMQLSLRSTQLRRELFTTDSSSAYKMCLMAGSQHAAAYERAYAGLRAIEARFVRIPSL